MTTLQQPFAGQGHDIYLRGPRAEDAFTGDAMLSKDEDAGAPVDLPAGQKMISAISGSLLTALLGEPPSPPPPDQHWT